MLLANVEGTCSMRELWNVTEDDYRCLDEFVKEIEDLIHIEEEKPYSQKILTVLHNTNKGLKERNMLRRAGFKQIFSYNGDEGKVFMFIKVQPH